MDKKIITRFVVVTEETIRQLLILTQALAREKYTGVLPEAALEAYIGTHFSPKQLMADINSFSNQWLVVYADQEAVGYACITTRGQRPEMCAGKKAVRLTGFGVLAAYRDTDCLSMLFAKCMAVVQSYEVVWVHEYAADPVLAYFEANGFERSTDITIAETLSLPMTGMVKRLK
ncbi:N-acetyltransferase [Chitinophaga nivalis]|uniref:N-acetyltransferase n=1 Tax=Chitinophaga nivalis TaxID=2991709 RepID=A0ABT3IJ46_9BACT|nr:N-acetyltransferase [Chitinophaga nivalis]MCW3466346.1 N-acetyltransferase [Chitinophaga nivalis]MCW3483963.1 N-acetyltransferase [Chitinophaga nivalis]